MKKKCTPSVNVYWNDMLGTVMEPHWIVIDGKCSACDAYLPQNECDARVTQCPSCACVIDWENANTIDKGSYRNFLKSQM